MGLILRSVRPAVVIGELNLSITRNAPIFVENEIMQYPVIQILIDRRIIVAEECSEYPGLPVFNEVSTKENRDKEILDRETQQKAEAEERALRDKEIIERREYERKCGMKTCSSTSFQLGVAVKAKLGLGIALFDCDLLHTHRVSDDDNDEADFIEHLWITLKSDEFRRYSSLLKVYITDYKEEGMKKTVFVPSKAYHRDYV